MSINKFELTLASHLEHYGFITFVRFEQKYNKSISSLKRHVYNLNRYLPADKHFILSDDRVINPLSYSELLTFIDSLDLSKYTPSRQERINIILVYSFFNFYVNMSKLYEHLYVSPTTRKKDSKELDNFLEEQGLSKEILLSKGIRITGREEKYRTLITSILMKYIEISVDDSLIMRKANNPLEKLIYQYFYCKIENFQSAVNLMNSFFEQKSCRLSYHSKKFLLIYITVVLYRNQIGIFIENVESLNIETEPVRLFENENENRFLSYVIGSFDFTIPMNEMIYDEKLVETTKGFIELTQNKMLTKILTYNQLFEEVYAYLKKTLLAKAIREDFYDIKLEETHIYVKMYAILTSTVYFVEDRYGVIFSDSQIAGLALIFRKYVIKNKIAGRNTQKIVIVTNSAIEKANFFFELLRQYVDIRLVAIININELHLLDTMQFDHILIFSGRIKALLRELGLSCIKLNFYITSEEVQSLLENGFSTAARKINLDDFIVNIVNKPKDEIRSYITSNYQNYFIG